MSPRKLKKIVKHFNTYVWESKRAGKSKKTSALVMHDTMNNRLNRLIMKEQFQDNI